MSEEWDKSVYTPADDMICFVSTYTLRRGSYSLKRDDGTPYDSGQIVTWLYLGTTQHGEARYVRIRPNADIDYFVTTMSKWNHVLDKEYFCTIKGNQLR